jgi:hypothetical protein
MERVIAHNKNYQKHYIIGIIIFFIVGLMSCYQKGKSETYLISDDYYGPIILIYGDTTKGIMKKELNNNYDFRKSNLIRLKDNMPDQDFIDFKDIAFFELNENEKRIKIPIILNESEIKNDTTKYVFLYNSQIGDRNHKISYQSIIISDKIHYHSSVQTQNYILDSLSK